MASVRANQEHFTDNPPFKSTEKFDHDTDTLLVQAKIAKEAASVMRTKQKKIEKKQQQKESKHLPKCIKKYNSRLLEIREAINKMQDALSEGGFTDMTREGKNKIMRSVSLPKKERSRFQEQTETKRVSLTENTSLKECMMCMNNETKIKTLEERLKSLQQTVEAYDELQQKYIDERDQCTKYQHLLKEEQKKKENALQSLQQKTKAYEELHQKYQDESDHCTKYQPLHKEEQTFQSNEKFGHAADTLLIQAKTAKEAAGVLSKTQKKIDKKQRKTTSKQLPKCYDKYNSSLMDIGEAINKMQDALFESGYTDLTPEKKYKVKRSLSFPGKGKSKSQVQRDTFTTFQTENASFKECMMCLKQAKKIEELEDRLKRYNKLHLEYQDERDQRTKYQRLFKEEQEGKKDALRRLSAIASSKLRDNNPNIADLSDQFRPTKIAEKMSELYDNQWTEAYSVLEMQGLGERKIIKTLLDMFMVAYAECTKLASENFFERVQRCIEIPAEGFQPPANYKVVMPDQLKQQVKEFRKTQAKHVVKELEMIVRKRIKSENQDVEAINAYLSHCIEIAWFCAIQDPPVVVRRDAPVMFDTNAYKEYTSRGKYTEFVVWPAMYLHDGGALLLKGVAQGSNTREPGSETSAAVHHRANEARNNMKPGTRQQQHNARTVFCTDNRTRPGDQTSITSDI